MLLHAASVTLYTVTGLANFGFTPLLWHPQGSQGCLEKQNYPLSSNVVVWCAKIGPKTNKVRKTSEMTRKTSKNDGFLTLFQSFLVLDPILAQQTWTFFSWPVPIFYVFCLNLSLLSIIGEYQRRQTSQSKFDSYFIDTNHASWLGTIPILRQYIFNSFFSPTHGRTADALRYVLPPIKNWWTFLFWTATKKIT